MLILYYHRVGYFSENEPRKLSVEPDVFETQIRIMKRLRCNFLPADDVIDIALGGKKLPRRAVLITFDDGYEDTLKYAFPLLHKYSIPSLMFIVTDYAGKTDWDHKLHRIMDWEDIKKLRKFGAEVGSHTLTHRVLTGLPADEMRWEVEKPKRILEEKSGGRVRFFAYPKGVYNREVIEAVKAVGYKAAFATKKGKPLAKENLFELRRIPVSTNDNPRRFLMKLMKYMNWL